MSFTYSCNSTPSVSPTTSLSSKPIQISTGSHATFPASTMQSHGFSSSTLRKSSFGTPSAYISDDDLFGADDAPYMREAPLPPRPAEAYLVRPLLPSVPKPRRRSSNHSQKAKKDAKVRFGGNV